MTSELKNNASLYRKRHTSSSNFNRGRHVHTDSICWNLPQRAPERVGYWKALLTLTSAKHWCRFLGRLVTINNSIHEPSKTWNRIILFKCFHFNLIQSPLRDLFCPLLWKSINLISGLNSKTRKRTNVAVGISNLTAGQESSAQQALWDEDGTDIKRHDGPGDHIWCASLPMPGNWTRQKSNNRKDKHSLSVSFLYYP